MADFGTIFHPPFLADLKQNTDHHVLVQQFSPGSPRRCHSVANRSLTLSDKLRALKKKETLENPKSLAWKIGYTVMFRSMEFPSLGKHDAVAGGRKDDNTERQRSGPGLVRLVVGSDPQAQFES
ncbi:hypothetical protein RRG08_027601 [Elysia crispata]|uniref:Uncharacterized protein n=1 Tax=Elysia crispata TaxID=231223 RepID=A0AAE1DXH8_9GAST|nr:hypothetical protein RRG08_027601 [Elysia crispata]